MVLSDWLSVYWLGICLFVKIGSMRISGRLISCAYKLFRLHVSDFDLRFLNF